MSERPNLDKSISLADFLAFYWHTDELRKFCKENGLDTLGGKLAVSSRIKNYLKTGLIEPPVKKTVQKKTEVTGRVTGETLIPENILLTDNIREYFEGQIDHKFRFTKELIAFFRNNPGKSMEEALAYYRDYKKDIKKKVSGQSNIPEQCQYNQFVRDYLDDNKDKTFADAVKEWNSIRNTRSDFKYKKRG